MKYSRTKGNKAPTSPNTTPSITNGALMKKSVAPTILIINISSFLTEIPIAMVVLIRNIATAKSKPIIVIDITPTSELIAEKPEVVLLLLFTFLTPSIVSI